MKDIETAASWLRKRLGSERPRLAVVLGSGLGKIADSLDRARSVDAREAPGFAVSQVPGHAGAIHLGRWGSCPTLVFQGRVHLYEGHPVASVTLPVRAAAAMGASFLILTNAAGSLDRRLEPGSLLRAHDLLDLFFRRMRGSEPRPRLAGAGALDADLGSRIDRAARGEGIRLATGLLSGSLGPSYETAAEVRWLQRLGVTAACMSTIPEAFAAARAGMRVAVVSLITNFATGIARAPLDHLEVVERAAVAGESLGRLLRASASRLDGEP